MVRIERAMDEAGLAAAMLLQIHDELIFEVPAAHLEAAALVVKREMETAALGVPLEVTLKTGRTWYEVETLSIS